MLVLYSYSTEANFFFIGSLGIAGIDQRIWRFGVSQIANPAYI